MLRKKIIHLKTKTRQKLIKANKKINLIIEKAGDDTTLLTSEEKEFLSKTKEENKKAKKELNDWLQFIYEHTKELIKSYEQKNDMNIKKLKEIEKKLGNFKKGETLIKDINTDENKNEEKVHEAEFKEKHGHPMLKINKPEMCPISINCSFNSIQ